MSSQFNLHFAKLLGDPVNFDKYLMLVFLYTFNGTCIGKYRLKVEQCTSQAQITVFPQIISMKGTWVMYAIMCWSRWWFAMSWVSTSCMNYTCPGVVLSTWAAFQKNSQFTQIKWLVQFSWWPPLLSFHFSFSSCKFNNCLILKEDPSMCTSVLFVAYLNWPRSRKFLHLNCL